MKKIDESRLESDVEYRFEYLCEFIGFGAEDIAQIHSLAGMLAPLVSQLVDGVYYKLIQQDATWRHFVPRQDGFAGPIPAKLDDLDMEHPQIKFRKQHLSRYFEKLVTAPFDAKLVTYLNHVGCQHTSDAGNPEIRVPLVQMNALMGYVSDLLNKTILRMEMNDEARQKTLRAFNKLLWIQNDLINRHYAA